MVPSHPLIPFVPSEVETPIEVAPRRWVSRLRSTRTEKAMIGMEA